MLSKDLFEVFCSNRNIKDSTIKSYRSAILKYESFHKVAMKDLIGEAMRDEENMVPLKNRHIKNRLLNFRSYLLDSELSINTVKTYFSRIKTFYRHFEIELPYLNDIKFDEEYLSSYYDLPTRGDIRKVCSISSNAFRALVLFISSSRDIVPAFYLKRIKTNKFYYAFCSPEASHHIVKYLISRKGLSLDDRLFDFY